MPKFAADLASVEEAALRIGQFAHRTPVMSCRTISRLAGCELHFKCENFQRVGAFKFRGACNAVMKLSDNEAAKGVLTHSSGNHAQALALAARMRGIPAYIVMPTTASTIKRKAVEDYGGRVIECAPRLDARESTAESVREETEATFIAPYDDAQVIAGQGTAALELLHEVPDLEAIVAPVGGGGLISGICAVTSGRSNPIQVIAAEPSGADDAARSKAADQLIPQGNPQTIADGLLTSLGELTWPYVRNVVREVITVDDPQTIAAMRLLWERAKLLVEPSAAVALAAVLSADFPGHLRRVGVVLSGGNVNLDHLPW